MTFQDRIFAIEQAQELMREANQLIKEAVRGTESAQMCDAYVTSHLEILIDSDHCYFTSSTNLENIKESLKDEEEREDF